MLKHVGREREKREAGRTHVEAFHEPRVVSRLVRVQPAVLGEEVHANLHNGGQTSNSVSETTAAGALRNLFNAPGLVSMLIRVRGAGKEIWYGAGDR